MVLSRIGFMSLAILFSLILSGCTTLSVGIQGIKYPQDTAILIDDSPYLINTFKCAKIIEIRENGRLICNDLEGRKSAQIPRASERHRNGLKNKLGIEWASPEHQDALFHWYYGGGKEEFEEAIEGVLSSAIQVGAALDGLSRLSRKSRRIKAKEVRLMQEGIRINMFGDMASSQAHQQRIIQWRLDNVSYFSKNSSQGIERMRLMQSQMENRASQQGQKNQVILPGEIVEKDNVAVASDRNYKNGVEVSSSGGESALLVHHFNAPEWQPYNVSYFRGSIKEKNGMIEQP